MKFKAPHWLTVTFAAVGCCAIALARQFPDYSFVLSVVAGICTAMTAPTISSAPSVPPNVPPLALLALLVSLMSCARTPTVPQQANVASYGAALEACIAHAKATDGGIQSYCACQEQARANWSIPPSDGGLCP